MLPALEHSERPLRCAVRTPDRLTLAGRAGDRGCRGRRVRRRVARAGAGRCGHRLLPRPLDGLGRRVRGARPDGRRAVRRRRARPGRPADRLPGRAGSGRSLSSHLESRQEVGRILRRQRRRDDRVPRVDRHRVGQPLVRDGAGAGRAAAGDDHAALGADADAADRDRGRGRLPGRGARPAGRREPRLRDRRRRRRVLRRADARVRPPARAAADDDRGARAVAAAVQPLAVADHAALRPGRPQAGGRRPQRDAGGRRRGPAGLRHRPARRPRGDRARAAVRGPGVRRDAVVGRRAAASRAGGRRSGRA